jgi:hypothetical protein
MGKVEPDKAIRANFEQNPGQNRRTGRRRFDVRIRQPRVKWNHRYLDGQRQSKPGKQPQLQGQRHQRIPLPVAGAANRLKRVNVEGSIRRRLGVIRSTAGQRRPVHPGPAGRFNPLQHHAAHRCIVADDDFRRGPDLVRIPGRGFSRREVELEHGHQHQQRANQGVDEKLDGRIQPPLATPDADEQVHGHEHDLEKHVEQKQIGGREHANHERLHDEQQRVVFLLALFDVAPRAQRHNRPQKGCQHHQRQGQPVHAHLVLGPDGRNPRGRFHKLQPAHVVVPHQHERKRSQETQRHPEGRELLDEVGAALVKEKDDDAPDQRQPGDETQNADGPDVQLGRAGGCQKNVAQYHAV